ncbi:MAG TPA: FAD-dependent oxidoreductase [bacterium]|uniref:Ferredoxin--NAD(P)(+) reductase (Naphthalene dioxygenase/salicylate 5-hydroxylase ferredoxin-specific) n=1 Tax=candidate division TA06 bacterium ADurb.Bin417 TaxID=1852828 RepID=A0A1V5ML77_UNCT6|nr:MAG: Ferredoxin--NAD(P)(+) reductase (naphthalene dioxygenase/salicylate 5-hydroxylase ferredoxin-specific) [candidate division TA06 bacterium ADurb.Bin417]HNQ35858.1 FAD-dependent oxidoreductase [bacterium]HNS48245.1 FAD-dependent oxidoreductase [bacterium]
MNNIEAILTERIRRTGTVESFRFTTGEPFAFLPGQFLKVNFAPDRNDKELNKFLSFSSAPGRSYLEFTKRLSESVFSRRLAALKPGDRVQIQGPLGNCVFQDDYREITFLIGGIGITPVISIIEHVMEKRLDTRINLFYSNRTAEEIAFKAELDAWAAANPNLRIIYTITGEAAHDPRFFSGYINQELVSGNLRAIQDQVFFIYGPPSMTWTMKQLCSEIGCVPGRVKTENFVGY